LLRHRNASHRRLPGQLRRRDRRHRFSDRRRKSSVPLPRFSVLQCSRSVRRCSLNVLLQGHHSSVRRSKGHRRLRGLPSRGGLLSLVTHPGRIHRVIRGLPATRGHQVIRVRRIMVARQGRVLRVIPVLPAMVVRRVAIALRVGIVLLVAVRLSVIVHRAGVSTGHRIPVLRIPGTGVDTILITITILILTGHMYMVRPGIRSASSLARLRPALPSLR
jgi:hypothetical protein